MLPSIFDKEFRLKPGAMATVAERRFDDAEALCKTGENARANGVAYLAGFVIEILLKARLVKNIPRSLGNGRMRSRKPTAKSGG